MLSRETYQISSLDAEFDAESLIVHSVGALHAYADDVSDNLLSVV